MSDAIVTILLFVRWFCFRLTVSHFCEIAVSGIDLWKYFISGTMDQLYVAICKYDSILTKQFYILYVYILKYRKKENADQIIGRL